MLKWVCAKSMSGKSWLLRQNDTVYGARLSAPKLAAGQTGYFICGPLIVCKALQLVREIKGGEKVEKKRQ